MKIDEEFIGQMFAQLVVAQENAFQVLTAAIAMQLDASRLAEDLKQQIAAAQATEKQRFESIALKLCLGMQAAAQAVTLERQNERNESSH